MNYHDDVCDDPNPVPAAPSTDGQPRIRIRPLSNRIGYYVEDLHRKLRSGQPHIMAFHPNEEDARKDAQRYADYFAGHITLNDLLNINHKVQYEFQDTEEMDQEQRNVLGEDTTREHLLQS